MVCCLWSLSARSAIGAAFTGNLVVVVCRVDISGSQSEECTGVSMPVWYFLGVGEVAARASEQDSSWRVILVHL